jgi:site-specific recombinase XerD
MDLQSLADRFCDYSSHIRGFSRYTVRRYRGAIGRFLSMTNVKGVEELSSEVVRNWFFQGRSQLNWTSSTFRTYHKSLVVFFRWCVKNAYLARSPMDDVEVPKLEKRLPPKLTREEAMRLLETAYNYPFPNSFVRYRNHALLATFLFAGLRRQEALRLKFVDVDLAHLTLFVRLGKGAKDRIVPISQRLGEILSCYVAERQRHRRTCPEFFTSSVANRALGDTALRRLVKQVRAGSGIRFTVHQLRHTFATLLLEGGCDIYSLSRMMGHENIQTTTIYLAVSPQHLRSEITKHPLNNAVFGNEGQPASSRRTANRKSDTERSMATNMPARQ